jgi:hypothetical protein
VGHPDDDAESHPLRSTAVPHPSGAGESLVPRPRPQSMTFRSLIPEHETNFSRCDGRGRFHTRDRPEEEAIRHTLAKFGGNSTTSAEDGDRSATRRLRISIVWHSQNNLRHHRHWLRAQFRHGLSSGMVSSTSTVCMHLMLVTNKHVLLTSTSHD